MSRPRPPRCSAIARTAGEDPAGSAPGAARYLLVEVPLPWPRDFLRAAGAPEGLAAACEHARARGVDVRALAIAPSAPHARPGLTRVVHLSRPEPPFAAYRREEFVLPRRQVARLAEALLDEAAGAPGPFEAFRAPGAARDLLVCTHGSEDACCGLLGGRLYELVRREVGRTPGLRAWRVSHFGGHRFAPTLLDLPTGDCWAHVDADALRAIVRREGPVEALRHSHRGWGGFGFFAQLVGREAFLREGWAWVHHRKAGSVRILDPPATDGVLLENPVFTTRPVRRVEVRVTFEPATGGEGGAYEGVVELTGSAPGLGACGAMRWRRNTYRVVELRKLQ